MHDICGRATLLMFVKVDSDLALHAPRPSSLPVGTDLWAFLTLESNNHDFG